STGDVSIPKAVPQHRVLALDIGGTKMAAAVVDDGGDVLASGRVETPPRADAEALFSPLVGLCREMLAQASVQAIGVGCGGPMQYPEGIVSPLNIPGWREFPLREQLQQALELPCIVDNDAKAQALGEWWRGAG